MINLSARLLKAATLTPGMASSVGNCPQNHWIAAVANGLFSDPEMVATAPQIKGNSGENLGHCCLLLGRKKQSSCVIRMQCFIT
jgi:hypothetical protein